MDLPSDLNDLLLTVLYGLGILVGLLWLALPFAVFGIKRRLDRIAEQQRELIDLQRALTTVFARQDAAALRGELRPEPRGEGRREPALSLRPEGGRATRAEPRFLDLGD